MRYVAVIALALIAAPAFAARRRARSSRPGSTRCSPAMQCEVDPANVEVDDGNFDLDDVICADGQYDIKLDANYAVTEERKE